LYVFSIFKDAFKATATRWGSMARDASSNSLF
jgi:hypothetical protein